MLLPPLRLSPLPRSLRAYLAAFDLVAISVMPDGRVRVSRDPGRAGAFIALWTEDRHAASKIAQLASNAERPTEAIISAALELRVPLTDHSVVVTRATAAAARISRVLSEAQARGDLQFFNAEYKRRRAEAASAGKGFMSYGQARARLQRAIAEVAAKGGNGVTPELVARVFRSA